MLKRLDFKSREKDIFLDFTARRCLEECKYQIDLVVLKGNKEGQWKLDEAK